MNQRDKTLASFLSQEEINQIPPAIRQKVDANFIQVCRRHRALDESIYRLELAHFDFEVNMAELKQYNISLRDELSQVSDKYEKLLQVCKGFVSELERVEQDEDEEDFEKKIKYLEEKIQATAAEIEKLK